jgi:mycothiol system anti-sigma-R factor
VLAEVYIYLDAEAGDDDRTKIRQHLDECAPCLREFGIEQEVKMLVARACGRDLAPEHLRMKLRATLRTVVIEAASVEYQPPR